MLSKRPKIASNEGAKNVKMSYTPTTTNYDEIQENEIQVLESIFMEDFMNEAPARGAWNKIGDRIFSLRLVSSSQPAEPVELFVNLRVQFPATYPRTVATFCPFFADGISPVIKNQVLTLIKAKSQKLLGQEMVYEIAMAIKDILDDEVSSRAQPSDALALNEERAMHVAQAHQEAEKLEAEKILRQEAAEIEETRHLYEMVEKEKQKKGEFRKRQVPRYETARSSDVTSGQVIFDRDIRLENREGLSITFRSVSRIVPYRVGPLSSVFTVSYIGPSDQSPPILVLKEYRISVNLPIEEAKTGLRSLESDLDAMINLPSNPNILRTYAYRLDKDSNGASAVKYQWKISVLMSFAPKGSLRDLLEITGTVEISNVRAWIIQVLEGIDFLHRHGMAHGRLTLDNLLIEKSKTGTPIIKLADAAIQERFYALEGQRLPKSLEATSLAWLAPETSDILLGKPSASKDIWDVGVIFLQMLFSMEVTRQFPSPMVFMDSHELSPPFEELLQKVFSSKPQNRPSAFDLLPNEFLRGQYPALDEHSSPNPTLKGLLSPGSLSKTLRTRLDSDVMHSSASRYSNDFVETGRLGRGGFGEVVSARNKLDGTIYAIKKIVQSSRSALSSVLKEVMLLSRLNNPYIVRYYTAWIEEENPEPENESVVSSTSERDDSDLSLQSSDAHGLDFISSNGFPTVEFGYETDEEDSGAPGVDSDEGSKDTLESVQHAAPIARRRSSAAEPFSKVTLYIQMEYCEKQTLSDLIRGDLHYNVQETWRLFAQIVEGLAHVHSHGIIHRDIKPQNIFIAQLLESQSMHLKTTYFGLARPGEASQRLASGGFADPRLTASIGTSIYVAPEVRSSGGGSYNDKADMYSLGIVLFEMNYPIKTSMERARAFENLRQNGMLPFDFQMAGKELQGQIVTWLVKHDPKERPSSQELLKSGKIPSYVEDETIRTAITALRDKSSPIFTKLMNGLFSQSTPESNAREHIYDMETGLGYDPQSLLLQTYIKDKLVQVFKRHGAVESQRTALIPGTKYYSNTAVRLLDSSGSVVQLPYDLTLPFARALAKYSSEPLARKSYTFGRVFRDGPVGFHPHMAVEVDFDIISNSNGDLALREAEVLKVFDEILDTMPSFAGIPVVFHLSHSNLLDKIMDFCRIPKEKITVVKQIVSKLHVGPWTWSKICNELRASTVSVPLTSLDDLVRFDFQDPYDTAISKLCDILQETKELESVFRHLETVINYADKLRIKRKILVNPLASLNEKFYRGSLFFQCISGSRKKRVLCAGGRYDNLIREQCVGLKTRLWHAVGFNLAWEHFMDSMSKYRHDLRANLQKRNTENFIGQQDFQHCEILIDSADANLLRQCGIKVMQELWASNISAELVIDSDLQEGTSHHQLGKDDGPIYSWVILIKQEDILKIRNTATREDVEIRSVELIPWIRSEIRERDRLEGKDRPRSQRHGVFQDTDADRDADVTILFAQNKTKKMNRRSVIEDALMRRRELSQSFLNGPVLAVEMKDDLFEELRYTRLSDAADSWRNFIQSAPLTERQYLQRVRSMLMEKAKQASDPTKNAWIYNLRTKACMIYDLALSL